MAYIMAYIMMDYLRLSLFFLVMVSVGVDAALESSISDTSSNTAPDPGAPLVVDSTEGVPEARHQEPGLRRDTSPVSPGSGGSSSSISRFSLGSWGRSLVALPPPLALTRHPTIDRLGPDSPRAGDGLGAREQGLGWKRVDQITSAELCSWIARTEYCVSCVVTTSRSRIKIKKSVLEFQWVIVGNK